MHAETQQVPMLRDDVLATEAGGIGAVTSERGNLPLHRLAIRAVVRQLTCETVVEQVFRNCHDEFLEATYIFPLPGRHAVTSCVMKFGDRTVEAVLKERGEARADYDRAIEEGKRASIAEEERSEVFTIRVGNIPPSEEVSITLTLAGPVPVVGGEATLRIPLVVAPRYVPGTPLDGPSVGRGVSVDTDQAPDASRISPPTLLRGAPNPIDLQLEVVLDPAGLARSDDWRGGIACSLHSVIVSDEDPCVIRLLPGERVNRDFILRYPVLPATPQCAAIWSVDEDGQATVGVTVTPPRVSETLCPPRDVCVVLDRSGSMGGWKMVAARRAAGRLVDSLKDTDRFRLIAFDNSIEQFAGDWAFANDQQRWQATQWLGNVEARGGTELGGALRHAFKSFAMTGAPTSRVPIVIVVTDGQVANEDGILQTLAKATPEAPRVFTVGIDRAVNAGFLQRLAGLGRGECELVESEERLDEVMARFHRELGAPVLSHVEVWPVDCEFRGPLAPSRAPDVFAERPTLLFGRVDAMEPTLKVRVTAQTADGNRWERVVEARRVESSALRAMWGRARVRDLEDQLAASFDASPEQLQQQIIETSLKSGVLSRFTAFVAVDHAETVNPDGVQHQVTQAVDMPEGWADGTLAQNCFGFAPQQARRSRKQAKRSLGGLFRAMFDSSSAPPPAPSDAESVDSMFQEFTDTAIDFTESDLDEADAFTESDAPVKKLVDLLLSEGVRQRASHIGLLVDGDVIRIHFVIDGKIHERDTPPSRLMNAVFSRLAILGGMSLQSKGIPQHGTWDVQAGGDTAAVRIYSLPSETSPLLLLRFTNQRNRLARPLPVEVQAWWDAAAVWASPDANEGGRRVAEMVQADLTS